MARKVFKTIEEQIQIMQNKGLIIDDYDFAKDTLIKKITFLSGYRHLF